MISPTQTLILALTFGILVLLAGCASQRTSSSQSVAATNTGGSTLPATTMPASGSGKVLIRFKEFEFGKDWAADFEITNDTNGPISYIGDKTYRFAYCTLGAKLEKRNIAFTIRDFCNLGNFVSLQTLEPGQSMVLAAQKKEVHDLLYKNDLSSTVTAQIGFEIFVGNDRHRETVWSEQITFP